MSDDFSIKDKHPSNEMFLIPGANEKLDKLFSISKRIHEARGVSFASREHLRIEGAEWAIKKYHGGRFFIPNRLAVLETHFITEEDLGSITPQLAEEFESAVSEFIELMDGAKKADRKSISFNKIDKAYISYAADMEGVNFAQYVNNAATEFAFLNANPPAGIDSGDFGIQRACKCAMLGAKLHDAFTKAEIMQAMDVAGITPSQAAKLMAELERLRDARMNPEAGSMDVP